MQTSLVNTFTGAYVVSGGSGIDGGINGVDGTTNITTFVSNAIKRGSAIMVE